MHKPTIRNVENLMFRILEDISSKLLKIVELPKFFMHYFSVVQVLQSYALSGGCYGLFVFFYVVCLLPALMIDHVNQKTKRSRDREAGRETL